MRTLRKALAIALATMLQAGCSGGPSPLPSLSTGSVAGPSAAATIAPGSAAAPAVAATAAAPPAPPPTTPTQRTFQVASTAARAVKCGFNFDPERLKQQYLAAEAASGTDIAEMAKVQKMYDISFTGIGRGIASNEEYCTDAKTKVIKEDLNRHLAGDYSPRETKQAAAAKKQDSGFFSSLFDAQYDTDNGPKIGTSEWWEKQHDKTGR